MAFLNQRLVNNFPLWSKVRRDPSALGARLLDCFSEGLEINNLTYKRLLEEFNINKRRVGKSFIWEVILSDEDALSPVENSNGYKWIYPTIIGIKDGASHTLERVPTLTDLLMKSSERLSLHSTLDLNERVIWTSTDSETYNEIVNPERLLIIIKDSTHFSNKTNHSDRNTSGLHTVTLVGSDLFFRKITERINVRDDGCYYSNNIFTELFSVTYEGFNGSVVIQIGKGDEEVELDVYRTVVLDDIEGPLYIKLIEEVEGSQVVFFTKRFKNGIEYRQEGVSPIYNEELLGKFTLLDDLGELYVAKSIALSPENSYLYVLGENGKIYIYEPELPKFAPSYFTETLTNYIELHALKPYAELNETEYIWTNFTRLRYPIKQIQIKRRSPSGTIEYLQSNKTSWTSSPAYIVSNSQGIPSVDQWKDFRFETLYDELGQWDFICTAYSTTDITSYITSVYCGALEPIGTLETSLDNVENMYFNYEGYLAVETDTNTYLFNEHNDCYIIDERLNRFWVSEEYDTIEVSNG